MSDYKRETYYLYNYENGRKRNNVGFARVEQMNGKCKITSRIRVPSMNGKLLSVCLFIREQKEILFLPIGKMQISNMTGELRSVLDADNIMDMGYRMEEIKGMVIYDSLQKFFGSEWDDHKIVFQEFKLAEMKNKAVTEQKPERKKIEAEKQEITVLQAASFIEKQEEIRLEPEQTEKIEPESESKLESEYKSEPPHYEKVQAGKEITETVMEQPELKQTGSQGMQQNREQKEHRGFSENLPEIFYQFPQMYPFEDDEMTDCVRIEPQDIGRLPMESWILANNSFLLHSYYSYRHLLLARRVHDSGFEYVLCAPGICQNREQFMAAMFGFSDFKPARNVKDKNGEFGYWYMPVIIEEPI